MTASMGSRKRKAGEGARRRVAPGPQAARRNNLKPLPIVDDRPSWLKSIMGIQTAISGVTLLMVATTLGVYGWSVNSQQRWGENYRRLETLRRNERQLIAGTEAMKTQHPPKPPTPSSWASKPKNLKTPSSSSPPPPRPIPNHQTPLPATPPASPLGY
ncbi:MAG: hypothetical protein HC860_00900 [Alkalinema sp. RU_4_3]|nr:hypothetical protein [Alkalinema sp. RU_4_3]